MPTQIWICPLLNKMTGTGWLHLGRWFTAAWDFFSDPIKLTEHCPWGPQHYTGATGDTDRIKQKRSAGEGRSLSPAAFTWVRFNPGMVTSPGHLAINCWLCAGRLWGSGSVTSQKALSALKWQPKLCLFFLERSSCALNMLAHLLPEPVDRDSVNC